MRQIFLIASLLFSLILIGTVSLHFLVGHDWLDSAYLAVILLTTVGSRDAAENDAAKVFVIMYLISGLTLFSYGAFQIGQAILNSDLRRIWESRKMEQEIARLQNHFIVCGMGRMGLAICKYLSSRRQPFVVLDRERAILEEARREHGWLYVHGDSTNDEALQAAGVTRARGLTTVLPTDADNVYVVLSARMLSPAIQIVARASDDDAVQKLERAGATRVISPFSSGAVKMARIMLNPSVEDFLEITDADGSNLELADFQVRLESPYAGRKLSDTDLHARGIMVIGIRRANGQRLFPPGGNATIEVGDRVYAVGSTGAVSSMLNEPTPFARD